jgi:hypothetical protein
MSDFDQGAVNIRHKVELVRLEKRVVELEQIIEAVVQALAAIAEKFPGRATELSAVLLDLMHARKKRLESQDPDS